MSRPGYSSYAEGTRLVSSLAGILLPDFTPRTTGLYEASGKISAHFPIRGAEKSSIARPDGTKMAIRIFRPGQDGKKHPAFLFLHGGGYAFGSTFFARNMIRLLSSSFSALVISPEYRLSRQYPFPAALDDAFLALEYIVAMKDKFDLDADRIAVAGESAGGGLAAAVALRARDLGMDDISLQVLVYPMLDDRPTSSSRDNSSPFWNSVGNRTAWDMYLAGCVASPYSSPARATDLSSLPPAVGYVGSLDPFLCEDVSYFEALEKAGVEIRFSVYDGCCHAFDSVSGNRMARKAHAFLVSSVGEFWGIPSS